MRGIPPAGSMVQNSTTGDLTETFQSTQSSIVPLTWIIYERAGVHEFALNYNTAKFVPTVRRPFTKPQYPGNQCAHNDDR